MSYYAAVRIAVLLLVLVPLASAALVPLFGRAARRAALLLALAHLGLTAGVALVAVPALEDRGKSERPARGVVTPVHAFAPEFVPGDRGGDDGLARRTGWTLFALSSTETDGRTPGPGVQLFLGIDGLNLWLVALAAVMLPAAVLISWDAVTERPGAFYGWLFLLQAGLIGAFLSFDVILFYAFFELTLIPAFFLIGYWGVGSGRRDAARKFFLYTLAGSLLMLLGLIGVAVTNPTPVNPSVQDPTLRPVTTEAVVSTPGGWEKAGRGPVTFSLPDLMAKVLVWAAAPAAARRAVKTAEDMLAGVRAQPPGAAAVTAAVAERRVEAAKQIQAEIDRDHEKARATQLWLFAALMAGFLVKVPVWPFHTWLPGAYGEAPTGAVVMLSAVMSKLGTFGLMRLALPLVPDAALRYGLPVVGALAAFGIVYAALCAYAARDMKLVLAYSSVSHLGFLVLGVFAFNREGLTGAALHMVNHGLSTGALFAALGFLTERYRTTEQAKFGGLMARFPNFALLTFVLCLASVGLPGLNNFVSEMMMMAGLFDARNPGANRLGLAVVAAVGIFLSAWYTLTVLKRVFFNPPREPEPVVPAVGDVTRREFFAFGSLALLCLVLGLVPQPMIDTMTADVRVLSAIGDKARARAEGVPYVVPEDELAPLLSPETNAKDAKGGGGGKGGGGKGGGGKGGGDGKGGGKGGGGKGGGGRGGAGKGGGKGPMTPPE
jgi:NADH-quinone oxidoreductase subunit M